MYKCLIRLICEEVEFAGGLQSLFPLLPYSSQCSAMGFGLSDGIGFMCLLIYTVFAGGSLNMSWETRFLFFCAKETRKCT